MADKAKTQGKITPEATSSACLLLSMPTRLLASSAQPRLLGSETPGTLSYHSHPGFLNLVETQSCVLTIISEYLKILSGL